MPRRIEIELTSSRPDGTWTWRAAGAREPKGVLDGGLLYEGAKTGDVLRAEAEFELEGIVITSVAAPKSDRRTEAQTIEVVGPGRPEGPGVTTQLVGRGDRDRRDRRRGGDEDRRRERGPGRPEGRPRPEGGRPRREGGPRGDGGPRGEGGPRRDGEERRGGGREGGRSGAPTRESGRREGREGAGSRPPRPEGERRPAGPGRTSSQAERGEGGRARRLNPGSAHRKAVLESLPPEQQPIAEHLLRGGIPAVRTALHLEREKAEAEGRPAPNAEALLALAESLLPRLRAAEWRDRAEAAVAAVDSISMRDLRSVVAGADLARDEESRKLLSTLREAVDARVNKLHGDWTADITAQLDAGKVVRAVRLSARPPDAGARLDQELTNRLVEAASATMSPETRPDLWMSLLEAVAESPIRRLVTPTGLPADAPADLKRAAHQMSGSIPALAKLLGIAIPPPPTPVGARKRAGDRSAGGRPPRREGPAGRRGGAGADRETASGAPAAGSPGAPEAETPGAPEAETPGAPEAETHGTPQPDTSAPQPPAGAVAEAPATAEETPATAEETPATAEETPATAEETPAAEGSEETPPEAPAGEEHPASQAEQAATEASLAAAEADPTLPSLASDPGEGDGAAENPSPS